MSGAEFRILCCAWRGITVGEFRWEICGTRSLSACSLPWVDFPLCKMGQLMGWDEDGVDEYLVILGGRSQSEGFWLLLQSTREHLQDSGSSCVHYVAHILVHVWYADLWVCARIKDVLSVCSVKLQPCVHHNNVCVMGGCISGQHGYVCVCYKHRYNTDYKHDVWDSQSFTAKESILGASPVHSFLLENMETV